MNEDYPIGGLIEPYDIDKEDKLINEEEFKNEELKNENVPQNLVGNAP